MAKEKEVKDAKFKVIDDAIAGLEKTYGKGTIMRLGDKPIQNYDVISTGCLSLDFAIGVGGVPKGRIIEVFGPFASGKSSMALHIVAESQKQGGEAAFVDVEHALDLKYAKKLGVDTSRLLLSQPDFAEQALEIVETLVRTNAIDVIVIDSVAALVPRSEVEGDYGDAQMALQARLMSQAMRKLTPLVSKSNCCVIFINQIRDKVGVMFGSKEATSGGNALKFYASIRLDVRKMGVIKNGDTVIGAKTKVKVVKNKVAAPFREVEVEIIFGQGIDCVGDIVDLAIQFGIIKKSGSWFTYGEERFQGRDQLKEVLKSDPVFIENLKTQVLSIMNNPEAVEIPVSAEEIILEETPE